MKRKITSYLYHQAKKYHFDNTIVIDDLIHSSEESYNHFIRAGYSPQQAFYLVKKTMGNLREIFCFSSQPEPKFRLRQIIINALLPLCAIACVLFGYISENMHLFIIFDFFLMMTLLVCFVFFAYQKNMSLFYKRTLLSQHFYCIFVNITIICPVFFQIDPYQYLQSVGLLTLITNISFIFLVNKSGIKILLITIPCSILSMLLWDVNNGYLVYFYAIILTSVCSCVFLYLETYSNEVHYWLLIGLTIVFFVVSVLAKFPWLIIYLLYIMFSSAGCMIYYIRRRKHFRFHFEKINLHFSIFIYAVVFTQLLSPAIDIFMNAYLGSPIVGIDYFTPLVWSTILLCIDFIYFLCYHYIKECFLKRSIG